MENVIGWILVVALVALPVLFIWAGVKLYKRTKIKQEQAEQARKDRKAEADKWWKERQTGATHVGKTKYDYVTDTTKTTVTDKRTGQNMSYVHETNGSPDLLTTMVIADMLFNNKDSSSGRVKWDNDVPSVTETSSRSSSSSSWGFDDDDSRKSASSSFSSSDSSSSWDSGSSSSDSGPSSDW